MHLKSSIASLDALDASEPFDVCVIGSGPAGTIIARSLVSAGVKTLIVESGSSMYQWLFNVRVRSLAAYDFSGNTDYPMKNTKARVLGGNSNFWTGRCERLHPTDFEIHPYTPSDNPWPITYEELAPYYEHAENLLRVRAGKRSEYAPQRKSDYPFPAKPDISYLKSLFARAGVVVDDSPTATPSKTIRFFRVQKEILPDFLKTSSGTLITGLTATRLLPDSNGNIMGAELCTLNGERKIARAKVYVIACGGIETPRLLLLSRSEKFPEGIGNSFDIVGRGFNEHPSVNFYGKINHEAGTIKPTNKIGRSHQFYSKFRPEGLGSILPVFRQSWVLPHHTMEFKLSNVPRNIRSVLSRFFKATLYIGVTIEQKISMANRVTLSENRTDIFGNPIAHLIFNYSDEDLELLNRCRKFTMDIFNELGATDVYETEIGWSRHHQGTCRMGDNPKTSVVDRNLRVHECANLYLCGSEVFVTGGAMQPLLTIAALSLRLGGHLGERLRQG